MNNPAPDGIPLYAQAAHLPGELAATRVETLDDVTIYLNLGSSAKQTAPAMLPLLSDALLAAVCTAWGIHHPIDYIRAHPVEALGPLADLTVTEDIIPPLLARPEV